MVLSILYNTERYRIRTHIQVRHWTPPRPPRRTMEPSKAIPSEVHLSENVKVNPHKMDLLDSRMSGGRNGVRSSFSPLRSTSVISPSLHLDSVSRLSGFARDESGEVGSNPLSGEVAASDGFSQSSCKTLKCANQALKEHVALPTHVSGH